MDDASWKARLKERAVQRQWGMRSRRKDGSGGEMDTFSGSRTWKEAQRAVDSCLWWKEAPEAPRLVER